MVHSIIVFLFLMLRLGRSQRGSPLPSSLLSCSEGSHERSQAEGQARQEEADTTDAAAEAAAAATGTVALRGSMSSTWITVVLVAERAHGTIWAPTLALSLPQ